MKTRLIVVQEWEESERGWGVRPDGYTLHLSEDDRQKYCKQFWDRQPKGPAPDEYSRECGSPFPLDITESSYKKLLENKKQGKFGLNIGRNELDSFRPSDVVKKEKEEYERKRKEASEKWEKESEERKKLNEKLYGKNYDPSRGWRSI